MSYKLLVVTTVPITIRSFLLPFIKHFRGLGWQVDGMAQGVSEDIECVAACDRVWDIQWSRNVFDPRNLVAGVKRVQEVVKAEDYDLVHVHTPIAAFVTRFALRNFQQTKVIYTAHGFHFYRGGSKLKNAVFFNLEKLAGRWTDYLVTINREDEAAAKQNHFLDAERIRYHRGIGVDTSYYAQGKARADDVAKIRQEFALAAEDSLFLAMAEFSPRKRHRDLIAAFAQLNDPQVHLALAGEGPLKEDIKQLTVELGLASRVHFLGFRKDVPSLIQAAKALLLVSQQEGLPRSIMEAMCLETPVIGTDIRGTRDLLEDGCGLLVNLGDIEAISQAMRQIIDEPEQSSIIASKARAKMANYDLKQIIKAYSDIYNEAIVELGLEPIIQDEAVAN